MTNDPDRLHIAPTRRALITGGLCVAAAAMPGGAWATEPPHSVVNVADFDELWRTLGERYCFFGEKRTDWNAVRALYRPQALAATSRDDLVNIVTRVLRELYDAHTFLHGTADGTVRSPYFDLWVEPEHGDTALVTSVRDGSAAADAGVQPGDVVLRVNGAPVGGIAATLMPRCLTRPDPAATSYALNIAVSGHRAQPRRLTLRSAAGTERELALPLKPATTLPDVESRLLPSGHGLIVIRSFADQKVVDAVDAALLQFKDTPGLIIDLRQNGGGDTAIARPIMGRFITARKPYARMRRRDGDHLSDAWTETVDPRGPFTYTAPVVVLTTRWSASMAEGFPMGMRGLGRATIVGTPMMRVGAAVFPLRLDLTGIELQYSAEPVYDVHDQPRWLLRPDVEVAPREDILAAGVAFLQRRS
ncbi:MAG: peptidase [Sphingomonas bacterium]|nr:peptidase [Sphingomonas bacterium]